jgi:hypothetical protein
MLHANRKSKQVEVAGQVETGRSWSKLVEAGLSSPVEGAEAKWREVLKTESGEKSHSYTVTEIQEKSHAQRVEVAGQWLCGCVRGCGHEDVF